MWRSSKIEAGFVSQAEAQEAVDINIDLVKNKRHWSEAAFVLAISQELWRKFLFVQWLVLKYFQVKLKNLKY
jgi:DNA helicase TIP49 (TBP-interacting protein)